MKKILASLLFLTIICSALAVAKTSPASTIQEANPVGGGSSLKCYTIWSYDSVNNEWFKRDLVSYKIWKHGRTGEEKVVAKITKGDKCKAYNPFTAKLSGRPPKEIPVGLYEIPRSQPILYDWHQNYFESSPSSSTL